MANKTQRYLLQTKNSIEGTWNDAEIVDCESFRRASYLAGEREDEFNTRESRHENEKVLVRAVPMDKLETRATA